MRKKKPKSRKHSTKVRIAEPKGRPIQLRYTCGETGREVRVSTGTYYLDEAIEQQKDLEARIRLGHSPTSPSVEVHGPEMEWELFREKYRDLKLSRLRDKSIRTAESWLDICERIVKPKTLADMCRPETLVKLQNQLADGVLSRRGKPRSKQTVRSCMANLIAALNWAATMGWLNSKIAFEKLKASTSDVMKKGRPISEEEFKLFRSKTEEVVGATALSSWLDVIDGLVESGLRISELMQVSWDLPETIIPIWQDGKEPTLFFPYSAQKNDKDQITPLLSGFEKVLQRTPKENRAGFIFNPISLRTKRGSEPTSDRPKAEWVGNVIGKIGKKSGIIVVPANSRTGAPAKYVSAHDLRRTCGQRLQDAGVPVAIISNVLRHGSSATTRKHYIQGNVQNDAKLLREVMDKKDGEEA